MCQGCRETASEQIIKMLIAGFSIEVAMRLERDAVVQRCLKDKVGQEAIDDALELSKVVEEQAEVLTVLRDTQPDVYETLLVYHMVVKP
jgi:hypothetical protein